MEDALQRGDVVSCADFLRQLEHADEHRGHGLRVRHFVVLDCCQKLLSIEVVHDDRCPAESMHHHVPAEWSRVIEGCW